MKEEKIEFETAKIFYNPEMQFCRSFFSLTVGAIEKKISLLDAFSASGIRGMRYASENANVKQVDFLEANDSAIPIIRKNLAKNKIKAKIIKKQHEKYFANGFFFYDFIEIDPFGTPAPYLWSTFYGQNKQKEFYLSVTATDVAVLCGNESKACLKNYHSKNLNNEFTHENGTRILIKRIAEVAAEFNFGVFPLVSLSDRHYIKVLLLVKQGAKLADESIAKLGYVSYCLRCNWRASGKRMESICKICKVMADYAGLLWLGELYDKSFIEKMLKLNKKRKYKHNEEIEKTLKLMLSEADMPVFYYDLHVLAKKLKLANVPKMDMAITNLRKKGFKATRTHFASTAIKTDANVNDISR